MTTNFSHIFLTIRIVWVWSFLGCGHASNFQVKFNAVYEQELTLGREDLKHKKKSLSQISGQTTSNKEKIQIQINILHCYNLRKAVS